VEGFFVLAGIGIVSWCAVAVQDVMRVQQLGRETIESPRLTGPPPATFPPASIPRGTPLAELSLPRLGLSAVVLHGSDDQTLLMGLGHIENTPLPGESGNIGIAGHRDSFFRPLRHVQLGDDVVLDTPAKRVHYRVSSYRVVEPSEVSVLDPTTTATLTLVTCYPFSFVGHAPDRFVVQATVVEDTNGSGPARDGDTAKVARSVPSRSIAPGFQVINDRKAVQDVVERFRVLYNARRARDAEVALMTFHACEVAISSDTATATCPTRYLDSHSHDWSFKLRRNGSGWVIKSVATAAN
jgi:sortase A